MRTSVAVNLLFTILIPGDVSGWVRTPPANPAASSIKPIPQLASPYSDYRLKLSPFVPSLAQARGVLLTAHINNGPALNLLLDSGARDVVVKEKAARKSGVWPRSPVDLIRIESPVGRVPTGIAKTFEIDRLSWTSVPIVMVSSGLAEGIDGVVPLVLFSRFLIQIDFPERTLNLTPYAGGDASVPVDAMRARVSNGILLLHACIQSHEGYLLLDTGSAFSAIAASVAKTLRLPGPVASLVETPTTSGMIQSQPGKEASFQVGTEKLIVDDPLVLNLTTMSRYHGMSIIGVVGFPALEHATLSLNYRDHALSIAPARTKRRAANE